MTTRDDILQTLHTHLTSIREVAQQRQEEARVAEIAGQVIGEWYTKEYLPSQPETYPPEEHQHEGYEDTLEALSRLLELMQGRVDTLWAMLPLASPPPMPLPPLLPPTSSTVSWEEVQDKPKTFPPSMHLHPQDSDLLTLLALLYERGSAGEVLTKEENGVTWKPVPVNAFYYPSGGGGGGSSGWLPVLASGLPDSIVPTGCQYVTGELAFDVEVTFAGEVTYV